MRTRPAGEDLVLVHGDATFDNILIDADQNIGFIDCGHAGRGDRHLDLAAITEAIGTISVRNGSRPSGAPTQHQARRRQARVFQRPL